MPMESSQHHAIVTAERVASVLSVVGACFIITTFLSDSKFRKPINRLVFYAAWGNLFANVGTLIARSGIELGVRTPLCQFQGLLIHWYEPHYWYSPLILIDVLGSYLLMRYGPSRWRVTFTSLSSANTTRLSFEASSGDILEHAMEYHSFQHLYFSLLTLVARGRCMETR